MLEPGSTRGFERAVGELQAGLFVVKVEERYEPTFSYRWDLVEAWLPEAVRAGRRLGRPQAVRRLVARYLGGAAWGSVRGWRRLFGLPAARCRRRWRRSRGGGASRAGVARDCPATGSSTGAPARAGPDGMEPPPGFRYIDAHTHLHPPRLFAAIRRWFDEHTDWHLQGPTEPDAIVAALRGAGVERFAFFSYAHRPGMARELNRWIRDAAPALPDGIPLGTVHAGDDDPGAIVDEACGDFGSPGSSSTSRSSASTPTTPGCGRSTRGWSSGTGCS